MRKRGVRSERFLVRAADMSEAFAYTLYVSILKYSRCMRDKSWRMHDLSHKALPKL